MTCHVVIVPLDDWDGLARFQLFQGLGGRPCRFSATRTDLFLIYINEES